MSIEYFDMGHAEPVDSEKSPHSVRAVFDASAKTSTGVSLNHRSHCALFIGRCSIVFLIASNGTDSRCQSNVLHWHPSSSICLEEVSG